jgi:hypothetical protein
LLLVVSRLLKWRVSPADPKAIADPAQQMASV